MKDLLYNISRNAIKLDPGHFSEKEKAEQWIGRKPASDQEIMATETRLGIKLPKDYVEFLKTSNGTSEILSHTFSDFLEASKIEWLNIIDKYLIECYAEMGKEYIENLENSILVAGIDHCHRILLIQPFGKNKDWQYWEFASYIPGESAFNGIESYLDRINTFLEDQLENKES
jgi:SMI1 / KNR4 family (SUKH-1)